MKSKTVIACDLDRTLAKQEGGYKGDNAIGPPIPAMVDRVKRWLKEGRRVIIFTARANNPEAIPPIRAWLRKHIGQELPVTAKKLPTIKEIWDDRAVTVEKNTGKILTAGKAARRMALA